MNPTNVFSALILGVAGFLATSGDNLVILLGLYGGRTYRPRDVFVGYVGAVAAVIVVGRALAVLAHQAPPGIVGYLGIIPLTLGVGHLIRLVRHRGREETPGFEAPATASGVSAVALITLASSADSLATFSAIFADTRPPLGLVVLASAVGCATGLAIAARRLVHHTDLGSRMSKAAPYVMPFLLIAIGLFILADTPTDVLGLSLPRAG